MFLQSEKEGHLKTVFLDETGRIQMAEASVDSKSQSIAMEFLDDYSEDTPLVRRWVYQIYSKDRYIESLFEKSDGAWHLSGKFELTRVGRLDSD